MTDAKSFCDASCPRCQAKISWYGRVVDCPACRHCGHQIDKAALEHDQDEMNNFRELLNELRKANRQWNKWRKARIAAGLTRRQAARLLEVAPATLSEIERGENTPSQALADRMARCYGG